MGLRGPLAAKGQPSKKDPAAEEVLLGQPGLNDIICPRKTHYNQRPVKRNQCGIRTVASAVFSVPGPLSVWAGTWNGVSLLGRTGEPFSQDPGSV